MCEALVDEPAEHGFPSWGADAERIGNARRLLDRGGEDRGVQCVERHR